MKYISNILVFSLIFIITACLADVDAPNNDPAIPKVSIDSESMTRVSVSLTGSFSASTRNPEIVKFGFDLAEGSFGDGTTKEIIAEKKDGGSFTAVATIQPGKHYVVKSWFSNGQQRKYSQEKSFSAPLTSAATISDVRLENGRLVAEIKDNGGRGINELGFIGGETSEIKEIKRNRKMPATAQVGNTFSLELSSFAAGSTYYIIAYAENSDDPGQDIYGYSRNVLEVTITDEDRVEFEDENFGAYVIANFDVNGDGKMSYGEMKLIEGIDVVTDNIFSVKEIWLMPELKRLSVRGASSGAGKIASLDIGSNEKLHTVICDNNQLDSLVVSSCPRLDTISCSGNHLTEMLVDNCTDLHYLNIGNNQVERIDIEQNKSLANLIVRFNDLSELDISSNPTLKEIDCGNNHIRILDLTANTALSSLDCSDNELTSLDMSKNANLNTINVRNNQIGKQDISANRNLVYVDITANPLDTLFLYATQRVATLLKPDSTKLFYVIDALSIRPDTLSLQVGEVKSLEAVILPAETIDKSTTWVSSNEKVASVSDKGQVKGLQIDTCTITAFCGGKTAFCKIIVNPVPVSEVKLDKAECTLLLGETLTLQATVLPENASDKTVSWSSSDESVAKVSQTGSVVSIKTGTTNITASAGGLSATCRVTVIIPVTGVILNTSDLNLTVGATTTLTATVLPADASDKTVTWSSNDPTVATVSNSGDVTGIGVGNAIITAAAGGYSATCSISVSSAGNKVPIDSIVFPDVVFRNYVSSSFDTDSDGFLSDDEIRAAHQIYVDNCSIKSLAGLECFSFLTSLNCGNNQLTSLDVSHNTLLESLICDNNQLTSLDVSQNTALKTLWCNSNQLTSLDVSHNTLLENLICGDNKLTNLNISNNTALFALSCDNNQLSSLEVSNNTALIELRCYSNQLTSLDVSHNTLLESLLCYNNQLTSLDVSHNTLLWRLLCISNQLTYLDISNNTQLAWLDCDRNQLTSLDVSNNTALKELSCMYNMLTSLDVSNNTALTFLDCSKNPYLTEIWLKTGQSIGTFNYDNSVATIKYK